MLGERFYHRCLIVTLLAVSLTAYAGEPPANAEIDELAVRPPPRSINDITRMLADYRQHDDLVRQLRSVAEARPPETSDRAILFDFYWKRGQAAAELGRVPQQIADLHLAVEHGQTGSPEYARAMRSLAIAERLGGNFLAAQYYSSEAIKQVPQSSLGQLTGSYAQIISMAAQLGDFEMAQQNLAKLESVLVSLRNSRGWTTWSHFWLSSFERARGDHFSMAGKMREAEVAYRKSLSESHLALLDLPAIRATGRDAPTAENMWQGIEGVERGLAQVLLAQGKLVESESMARTALEHTLKRAGRSSPDVGRGLRVLSETIAEQGRYAESAKLSEAALASVLASGAEPHSLAVLGALRANIAAQVSLGNDVKALELYERMRQALEGSPEMAAQVLRGDLNVVQAWLRTGQPAPAEKMAMEMLSRLSKQLGEDALRTSEVRAFYAMALADRGERAGALAAFRQALPVLVERVRNDSEAETGSMRRQQRLVGILERYIRLLSEMQGHPGLPSGFDAANDAFVMADLARGSSVQRALTRSAARAAIKDPDLAQLAREEQDTQRRGNSLNDLLSQLLSAPPEQQLPVIQAKIRQDIEGLKQNRERLKKEISRRFPDYARLVDPPAVNMADVAKMLQPGEVLLSWYFGWRDAHVWAIAADGRSRFAALPTDRATMAAAVTKLRRALDAEAPTVEQIPEFDTVLSHQLYQSLFAPVAELVQGATTLLAVPHGELGQLPLSLLVTAETSKPGKGGVIFSSYRQVPWLMRQVAVAQLPSVTALASLRRLPPGAPDRLPFIGFGDPYFSEAQASEADKKTAPSQVAMRGVPLRLRSAPHTQSVDSAELALLPRLPDTALEIREIAKALGADPATDIFLHQGASEKTVFSANLANRRVVMFATHGLVPGELNGLTQPALALSAPGVSGGSGDGLLTQEEILSLKLNADWVVLSACNTAAGEGSGSEAVSGLGRAFFYAGARALLVSNWPVETEAARGLMTDLFRRQSADRALGKAEALRQAMLGMVDGAGKVDAKTGKPVFSYAHPLFWAPFVLVGD